MSNEQGEILNNLADAWNRMNDFDRGRLYENAILSAEKKEDEAEQQAS